MSSALINFSVAGVVYVPAFLAVTAVVKVFNRDDCELIKRWIAKVLPVTFNDG